MNRVDLLQQHFSDAGKRMAELPLYNPDLHIAALGFQPYGKGEIGVLVTPWCMNLIFLPEAAEPRPEDESQVGSKKLLGLPSGQYEFITGWSDTSGLFYSCSLFSPMFEFADQAAAEATAAEVIKALFVAEHYAPTDRQIALKAEKAAEQAKAEAQQRKAQPRKAQQISTEDEQPEVSRRGFLTGSFRREQNRVEQ